MGIEEDLRVGKEIARVTNAFDAIDDALLRAVYLVEPGLYSLEQSILEGILPDAEIEKLASILNKRTTKIIDRSWSIVTSLQSFFINCQIYLISRNHDETKYTVKREFATSLNAHLKKLRLAITHGDDDCPCNIYAIASRDGQGRYTFENKITKKRSGSYKSLTEILPAKLVQDVERKEGVIERRKKKADEGDPT